MRWVFGAIGAILVVLSLLFGGWPVLALYGAIGAFAWGVYVGYKGREREDFTRIIERLIR